MNLLENKTLFLQDNYKKRQLMLLGFFFLVWRLVFFVCFVAAAACLCEIFTFVLQKFEVSVGNIETATKRNLPVLGGGKIKLFRCKWHYYCCCYYYLNCSRVRLKKGSVCCCFWWLLQWMNKCSLHNREWVQTVVHGLHESTLQTSFLNKSK